MARTDSERLAREFFNPNGPARWGFGVIAVFILVMVGWGALAPLSGAVVANGVLESQGGRQDVQHPYGGVVNQVLVREGDTVEAGQPLLVLSDAEPRARYDTLVAERDGLLAARGRLLAERDGADTPVFDEGLLARSETPSARDAIAAETALMAARLAQYRTQQDLLAQQATQFDERLTAIAAQTEALATQRDSIEGERTDAQALLDQQLVERGRVLALERDLTDIDGQIAVLAAEAAAAEKSMTEAGLEAEALERDRIAAATGELRSVEAQLAEIAPQVDAAADALSRIEVTAPVAGRVTGQTVVTEGGVIAAGAVLMNIVPQHDPYVVEAQMRLSDITSVAEGAQAEVRLLAVPASTRPDLMGRVENVSADRVVDERTGESYYALRVALDPQQIAEAGLDLQAGMPVQVIVPTTPRTMIDYIVSPLRDELTGALREF